MRRHKFPHWAVLLIAFVPLLIGTLIVAPLEADGARRFRTSSAIALTFDDGPDPRYTPAILDTLARYNAKATFFVVGEHAEAHPALIERMLAEGHEVAHHTHSHPRVERLSEAELVAEMDECLDMLGMQGVTPTWYRPPRKQLTELQERLADERGMGIALWARCFERARFHSAEEMAEVVARETDPGEIVLAHDGLGDRSMTLKALPLYLEAMQQRGLESVTLSELQSRESAH